jgi:hypothetical protein
MSRELLQWRKIKNNQKTKKELKKSSRIQSCIRNRICPKNNCWKTYRFGPLRSVRVLDNYCSHIGWKVLTPLNISAHIKPKKSEKSFPKHKRAIISRLHMCCLLYHLKWEELSTLLKTPENKTKRKFSYYNSKKEQK